MKRPTPEQIIAAGKAILEYQAANHTLQHEAGTALGYSAKQTSEYTKRYRQSLITTEFVTRLDSAVARVRAGYSIADACRRHHVVEAALCQALRQQQSTRRHFEWR
jgi:hypothetical protein